MTSPRDTTRVVAVGEAAPAFQLPAHPSGTIQLADFLGRRTVVLIFYFWDEGPGAIRDLRVFTEQLAEFRAAGSEVLAVSTDDVASHATLAARHGITVEMLADVGGGVGRAYGAVRGDRYRADRMAFVIDRRGIVAEVMPDRPDVGALLAVVRALED